jgi:FemAB-related protein (PEP-CTERM system-associated)
MVGDPTKGDHLSPADAVTVRTIEGQDTTRWDRFVRASPDGTFFHLAAWREIFANALHAKPHYLLAERDGEVVGVLPLVHQSSLIFGSELSGAPFCVEGGPLVTNNQARSALLSAALRLREQLGAQYLEFRSRKAQHQGAVVKRDLYATFTGPITSNDDENLKRISRKQRAVIRKAIEGSLTSEVDSDVDRLYRIYSESVRNLGTPVFSKRYFASLLSAFENQCDVVVVLDRGQPQAAVMSFYYGNTVLPYYGGGIADARKTGANDFLYWEVIRRAAAKGYTVFDFGRSKAGTGAFAFKKNWGFEPQWLEYEYWTPPGKAVPEKNPTNPKYRLLIEAWKRLPLPVANFFGPFIARSLG